MRFLAGLVVAAFACGAAFAQGSVVPPLGKSTASKPAAPGAPAAAPVTKLPEVPAGQWGDGILKDAKTQSYDGQDYAAIEFDRLQEHVDSICHFDRNASIIGKPVATIVGYRQNLGWPALVDGRQIDLFKTPDENNKLWLPFVLVDVGPFLTDVREDPYFKACAGMNFKVCTVAIYGRFVYSEAKNIPDWGADLTVGDKKCFFQLEHYRKMGIVDYGGAIGKASLDSFYQGMAQANGGH